MSVQSVQLVDNLLKVIDASLADEDFKGGSGCPVSPSYFKSFQVGKITKGTYDKLCKELGQFISEQGCAPIMVRLAWHDAGTFCSKSGTGGPRGCMRFMQGESTYGANNGLEIARNLLANYGKYKNKVNINFVDKYCVNGGKEAISVADLWALAAVVAVEVSGGPRIPFRFGRRDAKCADESVEDGRLPNAGKGLAHLRNIFNRMGFNDREIVALSGAHTLGSCHIERSGFKGDWTDNKLKFDNDYFKDLLGKTWIPSSDDCNPQFVRLDNPNIMMLMSDYCLIKEPDTLKYVKEYAKDEKLFFKDFSGAFKKLIEGGYNDKDLYKV